MRRTALAIALMLGLAAPVAAQAPPPVPPLPDTARVTFYGLFSSTCACSVGFPLFNSGTDIDSWISVYVDGVAKLSTDPSFGWTLTSATGSLGSIPRPITNAVLTFNSAHSATTVAIVGNQRPRRLSQFSENRGVPARDLNQAITTDIAALRELWDKSNRSIVGQPGETLTPLPSAASRVGQTLTFDGNGQPGLTVVPNFGSIAVTGTPAAGWVPVATGPTAAVWAAATSNIVFQVDNYLGANAGAKIIACLAAIPASGGACDARSLSGAQSATTTIAVPDKATLLLGGVTLTSSASTIVCYGTGSVVLGVTSATTSLAGSLNNQVGAAPCTPSADSSFSTIGDMRINLSGTTSTFGLRVVRHSEGVFNNLWITLGADASNTGIYLAADAGAAYYNQFYNMRVIAGGRLVDFEGNANENKFYGGSFIGGAYCFWFGPSDHNVMVSPSCEGWSVEAVHIVGGVNVAAGNQVLAGRFEGYAAGGSSVVINNQSPSANSVTDASFIGDLSAVTNTAGGLSWSTNYSSGGNKWVKNTYFQTGYPTGAATSAFGNVANMFGLMAPVTDGFGMVGLFTKDAVGAGVGPSLSFNGETGAVVTPYTFSSIKGANELGTGNYNGYLDFYTTASTSAPLPRMRISSTGLVGFAGTGGVAPTTSAYPALKRSGTTLQHRLGDDSADAPTSASILISVPTVVGSLPTCNAGSEGARAYVTDQNTAVAYRGAVTGGGTTRQAVLCSNSAWIQD